jgi:hypothetical protein
MTFDPSNIRLGKLPAKQDSRNLRLATYLKAAPVIPPTQNWYLKPESTINFSWGMMENDSLGDCAIAGPAHVEMVWSYNVGLPFTPTDAQVIAGYSQVSGYSPGNPQTDQGCILLDVLKNWNTTGLFGHKINAYTQVNPQNLEHVKTAIYLFGAVDIGLMLPISAQPQIGQVWSVADLDLAGPASPGSWGGHCVIIGKYDDVAQEFSCITWGQEQRISYKFFQTYCDEVYAPLSSDWVSTTNIAPNNLDMPSLLADLNTVQN